MKLLMLNPPEELLVRLYSTIIQSVLNCLVWIGHRTGQEETTDSQDCKESTTWPPFRTNTCLYKVTCCSNHISFSLLCMIFSLSTSYCCFNYSFCILYSYLYIKVNVNVHFYHIKLFNSSFPHRCRAQEEKSVLPLITRSFGR